LAAEALTLGVYEPSKGALPLEKVIQEDPGMIHYFLNGLKDDGIRID
ncbi:hypothetical protein GOV03_01430, partial [Candidatus Woesearchaeota archaeon]|nr:hypothetical protein [Candidatus Woesearchaeota archaeon]